MQNFGAPRKIIFEDWIVNCLDASGARTPLHLLESAFVPTIPPTHTANGPARHFGRELLNSRETRDLAYSRLVSQGCWSHARCCYEVNGMIDLKKDVDEVRGARTGCVGAGKD